MFEGGATLEDRDMRTVYVGVERHGCGVSLVVVGEPRREMRLA